MSKLKGFILSCALVLVTSAANSQMSVNINDDAGSAIIPPEHIASISVDPATNVISITTNVAYTVALTDEPCVEDCVEVAPTITSFNVVTPVAVGELTTVSWATTANADSCLPSGDYAGWANLPNLETNNSGIPVAMDQVGTFTFSLTCYNDLEDNTSLASSTVSRTVTVNEVVIDPNNSVCVDYESPLGGSSMVWGEFFTKAFPGPSSELRDFTVARYGYSALEFNTSNFVDTGALMTIESTQTSGIRRGSVSQCPGDFDVAPECKYVWGTSGGIIWSTDNYPGACQLDPDTTYYFNVTFTDGFTPSSSQCRDSKCVTKLNVYNP